MLLRKFMDYKYVLGGATLFCLAFWLRYYFLLKYPYPLMIHEQDAVAYTNFAKQFLRLKITDTFLPPLYPAIIAIFSFLPVQFETGARLASITMDSLSVLPLLYIARRYMSVAGAVAVGILWCFSPFSIYFTVSPLTQSTYLCTLLCAVAFLCRSLHNGEQSRWIVAAGIFSGLCYLARIEGILSFAAGFILCFALPVLRNKECVASAAKKALRFTIGFTLSAGPYLLYLHHRVGYWTISVRGEQELKTPDAVNTLNATGKLIKASARGIDLWIDKFNNLSNVLTFAGSNLKQYVAVYLFFFPLWFTMIAVAGLALLIVRKRLLSLPLLIFPFMTAPIYLLNLPKTPSYFYPMFPFVMLCFVATLDGVAVFASDMGMQIVSSRLATTTFRYFRYAPLVPVIYLSMASFATTEAMFNDPGLVEQAKLTKEIYQDAGVFLKGNSQAGEAVVTRWGLISYFAERPLIILPKGSIEQVVKFCRNNGGKYLVIDSISVYTRRQELEELLSPLSGNDLVVNKYGLQVVHTHIAPELGAGYVIYRIL